MVTDVEYVAKLLNVSYMIFSNMFYLEFL